MDLVAMTEHLRAKRERASAVLAAVEDLIVARRVHGIAQEADNGAGGAEYNEAEAAYYEAWDAFLDAAHAWLGEEA